MGEKQQEDSRADHVVTGAILDDVPDVVPASYTTSIHAPSCMKQNSL